MNLDPNSVLQYKKKFSVDTCYQLLVNTGKQAEIKYHAECTKTAQEEMWAYSNIMLDMFLL